MIMLRDQHYQNEQNSEIVQKQVQVSVVKSVAIYEA